MVIDMFLTFSSPLCKPSTMEGKWLYSGRNCQVFLSFFSFLIWMMGNGWMYLITKSGWIKPSWLQLQRFRFKSRSSRNTLLDMRCESNQGRAGELWALAFLFFVAIQQLVSSFFGAGSKVRSRGREKDGPKMSGWIYSAFD